MAATVVLLAGCTGGSPDGGGDNQPSESEMKDRFNEHDALNVEVVAIDDDRVTVEYWTSDNDDSPPRDEMAAMVDVYRTVISDGAEFERLDAEAYDPIRESLEFEWHVKTSWLDEEDTMQRVNGTRT